MSDVDGATMREVAGAFTPAPGGVGPLTNAMLLKQCVWAEWQLTEEKKEVQATT